MLRTIGDLLFVFDLEPLWQPLFQGVILLAAVSLGVAPPAARSATGSSCSDEHEAMTTLALRLQAVGTSAAVLARRLVHASALLLIGSLYSQNFLSPDYLLQQLQIASFLGVIATGAMLVILLGHIDLSVPWVVTVGGMMSTAAAGWWGGSAPRSRSRSAWLCGVALGLRQRHRRGLSARAVDDLHARRSTRWRRG